MSTSASALHEYLLITYLLTSNVTGRHRGLKRKLRGWCCMRSTFLQILLIFSSPRGLPVTVFHSTCIFCVYGMALYWPTPQFYVCVYISFVCRYVAPLVSDYNIQLCCDYFSSSSMVSRAFSVLCVYSKFGHHPHPLRYLCAKFRLSRGLHCSARPWRKIAYSITQSPSLFDAPRTEAFAS